MSTRRNSSMVHSADTGPARREGFTVREISDAPESGDFVGAQPIGPDHPRMVSLVAPCFNEQEVLPKFVEQVTSLLNELGADYRGEVVLVDDGSSDRTWDRICEAVRGDDRFRGVKLSRNFGQQAALTCGYEFARGDAVVSLDVDLQDPPEVVPEMVARWQDGADVVLGVRATRHGETRAKLLTAWLFYWAVTRLSGGQMRAEVGDFRLLSRRALTALLGLREQHRYVRGMVGWLGFRTAEVRFDRPARAAGTTHYTYRAMVRLAADAFASAGRYPLELAARAALLATALCLLYSAGHTAGWLLGLSSGPGEVGILAVVASLGMVSVLFQAVAAEYLGRIYEQVRGRPIYLIEEVAVREDAVGAPEFPTRVSAGAALVSR